MDQYNEVLQFELVDANVSNRGINSAQTKTPIRKLQRLITPRQSAGGGCCRRRSVPAHSCRGASAL